MLGHVTSPASTVEPACPDASPTAPDERSVAAAAGVGAARRPLALRRATVAEIDPATWDALAARNPAATPFSSWAFHRAWWDAYGDNAHEETLVAEEVGGGPGTAGTPVAIVPLMHRHGHEPTDAATHTTMRHGHAAEITPLPPNAKVIFFGASYHADYATILGAPADLPSVAATLADHLAAGDADPTFREPWDTVDLRRLRCGDPAAGALEAAFRECSPTVGWTVTAEREDVCPVVQLPPGGDLDAYLARLGKKDRHEIRRKVRRAEAAGELRLEDSADPVADLETFIDLHQRRWGADGLFPETSGGRQSRVFFRRLFEAFGPDGALRLSFLTVAGRRIAAGVSFETPDSILLYNAGVDPAARDLSPGIVMGLRMVERAIATGRTRLDYLRGGEPYKYEWGARDEPIERLLLRRAGA
jgi:CelD/BcsL family acetyltransferase involved in cellulose biosynthesis